jgi:hypothetical protein
MNRNCFEAMWHAWNFSKNSEQTQQSGRVLKIYPVYKYRSRGRDGTVEGLGPQSLTVTFKEEKKNKQNHAICLSMEQSGKLKKVKWKH